MPMSMKAKLAEPGRRLNGQVCVIPSAVATQAIAAAGADYVILDQEHAPAGMETLHAMIAATQGTDCAPLVRIPEIGEAHVKRALDAGAEGVCFPLARGAADARRCVASMRYPPEGTRGWGPFVGHSRWGVDMAGYTAGPARELVCMLLIETRAAVEEIEAIAQVEGVDCWIVASFDLSTDLGVSGRFDAPEYLEAVARIEAAAAAAGIPLGGVAFTREQAEALVARGYRITGGFDILWLKQAAAQSAAWLREAPGP